MVNVFENISDRNKDKLLKLLEANTLYFKKDTTILSSVKQDNFIAIIINGWAQIIKNDYNGNRIIIEELEEGDVFGSIISSVSNIEYDIIVRDDAKIILIDFLRIINNDINLSYYNQFVKNLLLITTEKIKINNERIECLTTKTIRNKLLEYFKINAIKNNSRIIYLPFNFIDLADYLAIDRSAMSREIKNLKDEGFITIKGKMITLQYDYFR